MGWLRVFVFLCGVASAQSLTRGMDAPQTHGSVVFSLAALVGPTGFGAAATLSFPFERLVKAAAPMHAQYTSMLASPDSARAVVAAAWRAAGLRAGELEGMASRARWSALLPEARVRVLRHLTESTKTSNVVKDTMNDLPVYYTDNSSVWLEGRLAWQLDRLVFASEEPAIERLRLEREQERARVAQRVIEQLGKFMRAELELAQATPGTMDHADALVRSYEAESALDVMTGGWFTRAGPR